MSAASTYVVIMAQAMLTPSLVDMIFSAHGTGHVLTPAERTTIRTLAAIGNLLRLKALLRGPRNSNDPTCIVSLASSRQQKSVQRQRTKDQGNERSQIEQRRLKAGLPEMRLCSID